MRFFFAAVVSLFLCLFPWCNVALANPVPPALTDFPPSDLRFIRIDCQQDWLGADESLIRYYNSPNTAQATTESDVDTNYPEGSYCGWFFDAVSNNGSGGGGVVPAEVSQETLDGWQATIDILQLTVSICSKIYPVVLAIRVLTVIVYS